VVVEINIMVYMSLGCIGVPCMDKGLEVIHLVKNGSSNDIKIYLLNG